MTRRWPLVEVFDAVEAALADGSSWVALGVESYVVTAAVEIALDGRALRYSLDVQRDRIVVQVVPPGRVESLPLVLLHLDPAAA